ncbi:uncharacterized protein LOC141528718 [Cotesia typhae]|uniref:uncharacterized protein LOC141528718 n=1 Tax=Cotesia typhae TaxID=2053667 RepID=UPI003D68E1F9
MIFSLYFIHMLNYFQIYRITPARFKELAALIAKTFPTESEHSYYVSYNYDSVTKTKILAKGKLFTRYNNVYRSRILSSGGIVRKNTGTKRKREERAVDRVQLAFHPDLFSDITDDEFQEKDNWLKENIDPWEKVVKLWSDTSKRRIYNLISDSSIISYIDLYPVLKHVTQGPNLIDIDFTTLYADKTKNLIKGFDLLSKQLIGLCEKKKRKPEGVKEILGKINALTGCTDSNSIDLRRIHILRLIPLLLPIPPPFPSLVANDPPWRLSKNEVQQYFIIIVKTDIQLVVELKNRREQLKKYGLNEQPIVSIVGDNQIKSCNIHINEKKYSLSSPLAAVDIAFKSFYSFQLDYPKEAEYPWIVLQHKIDGLKGERDGAVIPSISTFLSDLNSVKF